MEQLEARQAERDELVEGHVAEGSTFSQSCRRLFFSQETLSQKAHIASNDRRIDGSESSRRLFSKHLITTLAQPFR